MTKKLRNGASWESLIMSRGQDGDVFYSSKEDKQLTALACYYKVKIKTSRVVMIEGELTSPIAVAKTKVEIVNPLTQ